MSVSWLPPTRTDEPLRSSDLGGLTFNLMAVIPGTRPSRVARRRGGTTPSGGNGQRPHFPSVIGGPEWLPFTAAVFAPLAAVRNVSGAAAVRVSPRVGTWRECLSTFGLAAKAGNDRPQLCRGAAERGRRFPHRLDRVSYSIDEAVNQCSRVRAAASQIAPIRNRQRYAGITCVLSGYS
jgi:hypothetical protein